MTLKPSSIAQKYNRLACIYDSRWHKYSDRSLSFLLDYADISSEMSVLDIACGTGELIQRILAKNPQQQITGVDISEAMLEIARDKLKTHPKVGLYNADATSLPLNDDSFDLVICANAFHYFPSPELALAEVKRVLKSKGQLIILDWCRDYLILKIFDRIFKLTDSTYPGCYSKAELNRLLVDSGFEVSKNRKVRFALIWELIAVTAERERRSQHYYPD